MPTQKIDPKVIFASNAPAIDKPPVFSDKTKGMDVTRRNDGRPEIKEFNKLFQDTDLKILWLNENAVLPYDETIDYPDGVVTLKDGSFKQLSSGSWVEFLDDFADKDAVRRGIANRYDSSLTYNSGERVILTNGDIVKSTISGNTNDPNVDMTGWVLDKNKTVTTPSSLLTISNAYAGQVVHVSSNGYDYTYTPSTTETENGITVVGDWVMEIPDAYYCSRFLPASSIDNVLEPQDVSINILWRYAAEKGRPIIIDKPYYVSSTIKGGGESYPPLNPFNGGGVSHALRAQSNSLAAYIGTGEIKLVPSGLDFTAIILFHDVENVVVLDPKCKGDRDTHLTGTGEQGICYHFGACKNVYVRNPKAYNAWGDGYYFGFTFYVKPYIDVIVPTNVTIDNLYGYDLRRNGISLCGADNLKINGGYIEKTDGVAPKAGIDIEPEEDTAFTDKMFIRNTTLHNMTFVSGGYPYAHNVFGNRDVEVHFTGITRLINKGSLVTQVPMLSNCQLGSETSASYQQNGSITFDHVYASDIGSTLMFKYLLSISSPLKSIRINIDKYTFDSTNYEPEIALAKSALYTQSDGITVKQFVFTRSINQVKLDFETVSADPVPSVNYYLGIDDYIAIVYRGKGISFHGSCFIGGYDLITGVPTLGEDALINNVFISPAANPSDGGQTYGRVYVTNNERKVRYSLTPQLTTPQIGNGLQVVATGFLQKSTTPNASIQLKQMSYPAGVQVYSSFGNWVVTP